MHLLVEHRDVAQLVAHYVRDVGVASSNLVIPTEKGRNHLASSLFGFYWAYWANEANWTYKLFFPKPFSAIFKDSHQLIHLCCTQHGDTCLLKIWYTFEDWR